MKPDTPTQPESAQDQHQRALDRIEEMWDRALSKGDDDFYESVQRYRADPASKRQPSSEVLQRTRRKGKGI